MTLKCKHCGASFDTINRKRKYCSQSCFFLVNTGAGHPRWKGGGLIGNCAYCQKTFMDPYFDKGRKYCSQKCHGLASRGSANRNWKGGKSIAQHGYIVINKTKTYEHILIAEKALGKPLPPKAVVHHWDENPQNNEPSNLVICEDQRYHFLLHARARRLRDTGECGRCKVIKPLDDFHVVSRNWDKRNWQCKICNNAKC